MFKSFPSTGALTLASVVALPLMFGLPAHAQTAAPPVATTTTTTTTEMPAVDASRIDQQAYREEMQKIRAEHEELESERDTLKSQCMNAKGQDRLNCQAKWHELRQKRAALHQRMQALRVQSGHPQHHAHMAGPGTQPGGTVPAAAPTGQPGGMAPPPAQ